MNEHGKVRESLVATGIDGKPLQARCGIHASQPEFCDLRTTPKSKAQVIIGLSEFDILDVPYLRCLGKRGTKLSPLHRLEIALKHRFNYHSGFYVCGTIVYDVRIIAALVHNYVAMSYNIKSVHNQMLLAYSRQISRLCIVNQSQMPEKPTAIDKYAQWICVSRTSLTCLLFNYTWQHMPVLRNKITNLIFCKTVIGIKFDATFNAAKRVYSRNKREMFGDVLSIGTEKHLVLYLKMIQRGKESHVHLMQHLADARFNQIRYGNKKILESQKTYLASDHPRNKNLCQYVDIWLEMQLDQEFIVNINDKKVYFKDLNTKTQDCPLHKNLRWFKAMKQASIDVADHPDLKLFRCEIPAVVNSIMYGNSFANLPHASQICTKLSASEFVVKYMANIEQVDQAMINVLRMSVKLFRCSDFDDKIPLITAMNKSQHLKTVRHFIATIVTPHLQPWCYVQLFGRWLSTFGEVNPKWVKEKSIFKIVSKEHLILLGQQQEKKLEKLKSEQKSNKKSNEKSINNSNEESNEAKSYTLWSKKQYICHEEFVGPTFDEISVFDHATTTIILSKFAPILQLDMSLIYVDIMLHPVVDWVKHQMLIVHEYVLYLSFLCLRTYSFFFSTSDPTHSLF